MKPRPRSIYPSGWVMSAVGESWGPLFLGRPTVVWAHRIRSARRIKGEQFLLLWDCLLRLSAFRA